MTKGLPKRIHIVGAGNLGCFVAHSLAGIPQRPPITLLMLNRQLQRWEEHGSCIDLTTHGMKETRRGFEVERMRRTDEVPIPEASSPDIHIDITSSNETVSEDRFPQLNQIAETTTPNKITAGSLSEEFSPKASNPVIDSSLPQKAEIDALTRQGSHTEQTEQNEQGGEVISRSEEREKEVQDQQNGKPSTWGMGDPDDDDIIYSLIVSVKAPQTVKAIQRVAHRLTQESAILFLQNGMGIIDEVNEKLFPDEGYRPTYIIGVVSHGLYSNGPFSVIHAGEGTIALGVMPRMPIKDGLRPESLGQLATSARHLIRTMTRTPVFVAVGFPPTDLLQQQLDKLAVNCIINPLTAILDCKNGALLSNMYFTRVIRLLLAEISVVIKSLPELKNVPNVRMRFDTVRLERIVFSIANKTARNDSSMLQDVRAARQTEIDYINGYIVKRGEEMGIHCVMNYMLMHMVKGKAKTKSLELADMLPFAGGQRGG
ncbi:hypothetical protein N7G274_009392 [Stereocaulon virgatum]|uniref:2-dehydropantoate 2-reductase n=1 Tax=Stereocaulon virgatum TaxID=373712 RepID=A0ABR3ZWA7_9LECA